MADMRITLLQKLINIAVSRNHCYEKGAEQMSKILLYYKIHGFHCTTITIYHILHIYSSAFSEAHVMTDAKENHIKNCS